MLQLDFEAKIASSQDATSRRDWLQGLVTSTSPLVCADLHVRLIGGNYIYPSLIGIFTVPCELFFS